ncbi:hypothetical protein SKAU_G00287230 [Synaphobranchus kaupii]|uniref:AN1-type domain-containing protein n=1 Tax=Synaphobranchus kaupii TaxID=118154 RepID=A0A9Q1EYC6_SYNKA|nr:hypothetical protein SKAU_G00287230 [Synaphobranchus kaupii]
MLRLNRGEVRPLCGPVLAGGCEILPSPFHCPNGRGPGSRPPQRLPERSTPACLPPADSPKHSTITGNEHSSGEACQSAAWKNGRRWRREIRRDRGSLFAGCPACCREHVVSQNAALHREEELKRWLAALRFREEGVSQRAALLHQAGMLASTNMTTNKHAQLYCQKTANYALMPESPAPPRPTPPHPTRPRPAQGRTVALGSGGGFSSLAVGEGRDFLGGVEGSSKTMNLCSKCFSDIEKKQAGEDCAPGPAPGASGSQSTVFCSDMSSSSSQSLSSTPVRSEEPSPEDAGPTCPAAQQEASSTDTVHSALSTPTKRACDSAASGSESEASPEKRSKPDDDDAVAEETRGGPKQRNRRRCYRCQTKLELVQQELGSCRCGYVFCLIHRLPEQHDCLFDHLGRGREEAVMKMVKLDRKVGRSCQRIGEECS